MTRREVLRTLFAVQAMPIAPSAATKDKRLPGKAETRWCPRSADRRPVAVAQTDLTLLSDRTGDGEASRPSPMAKCALSGISRKPRLTASQYQGVSPDSVIKADGETHRGRSCRPSMPWRGIVAGVRDSRPLAFRHTSIFGMRRSIAVQSCHGLFPPLLFLRGSMYLAAPCFLTEAAVSTHVLLVSLVGVLP